MLDDRNDPKLMLASVREERVTILWGRWDKGPRAADCQRRRQDSRSMD